MKGAVTPNFVTAGPVISKKYPGDLIDLIDLICEWLGDEALIEKVLVKNPERFYGFGSKPAI